MGLRILQACQMRSYPVFPHLKASIGFYSALLFLLVLSPIPAISFQADLFTAARDRDAAKVKQLIADGADVNVRDDKGRTPLHVAAERDAPEVVETLLGAGAVPILTDWRGVAPLSIAESKKYTGVADLLRKAIGPQGAPAPCELGRLRSDNSKGAQRRFLTGHPTRVREATLDALSAMGFVLTKESIPANLGELRHLEVRRMNPSLAGTGGGAGGERAVVDLEDTSENGRAGVAVSMDTKKGFAGRARQHDWSVPVLDEAECLLTLLGDQPLGMGTANTKTTADSTTISLADGVQVKLRLFRFVNSSQLQEGSKLPFIVMEDVIKDGVVLVRRGSPGQGSLTGLDKATSYGRQARFRFQLDSVRAVDGQDIRLRNSEQGAGRRTASRTAVTAASLPVLGLLLKGNEKGIRAGIVMVGYVDGERPVRVNER